MISLIVIIRLRRYFAHYVKKYSFLNLQLSDLSHVDRSGHFRHNNVKNRKVRIDL